MRVRVKFTKSEPLHYLGHLDVMRYFQKAIRRAGIPASFSSGFSPHIIMSFASPLGVGKVSRGEYFDLDLAEDLDPDEVVRLLKAQMSSGIDVVGASAIPETKKSNGMRVIAAASYEVPLTGALGNLTETDISSFLERDTIAVTRKTKRSCELTDIRPWIYDLKMKEGSLSFLISAGSVNNLRPELLLEAIASFTGKEIPEGSVRICRTDLYADRGAEGRHEFVPLLTCDSQ